MRALRLHAAGELRLHEEPDPEPQPGRGARAVGGVGLCGSDRHWFLEGSIGDAVLERPLVLGHELAGIGRERSPARRARRDSIPRVPCGRCALLPRRGRPSLRRAAVRRPRLDRRWASDAARLAGAAWCTRSRTRSPSSAAPLLEPLGVALHAVDLGGAGPGRRAAVFGCGPIGLLLVQVLQAAGVAVELATDPLPHRAAAARALGARRSDPADVRSMSPTRLRATTARSTTAIAARGPVGASCSSASLTATGALPGRRGPAQGADARSVPPHAGG